MLFVFRLFCRVLSRVNCVHVVLSAIFKCLVVSGTFWSHFCWWFPWKALLHASKSHPLTFSVEIIIKTNQKMEITSKSEFKNGNFTILNLKWVWFNSFVFILLMLAFSQTLSTGIFCRLTAEKLRILSKQRNLCKLAWVDLPKCYLKLNLAE